MFHAICAAQFALHNLGAKVLLFFDICKENRRFLVESRKSKVESRKSKDPKKRPLRVAMSISSSPPLQGRVGVGLIFFIFVRAKPVFL